MKNETLKGCKLDQLNGMDWLTISAAAKLCSEDLASEKTEDDVIKAGYFHYHGIEERLKIYACMRSPVEIVPHEPSEAIRHLFRPKLGQDPITGKEREFSLLPSPLSEREKVLASGWLFAGDVVELHWAVLERFLLLRHWWSGAEVTCVTRATSFESIPGWTRNDSGAAGSSDHWTAAFEATITPEVEILWDDLRVDRQELLAFLAVAKSVREQLPTADAATSKVSDGASAALSGKWDEHDLRRLLSESKEPAMTQNKLGERYGVTRQRIGKLLGRANESFGAKKASPFDALSKGGRAK